MATTSTTPVVWEDWLLPGCHLNSVGPKSTGGSELDPAVIAGAALVVSDSPAQLRAGDDPLWGDVRHLGAPGDRPAGRSLYASAGLAGSEVVLAHRLLQR